MTVNNAQKILMVISHRGRKMGEFELKVVTATSVAVIIIVGFLLVIFGKMLVLNVN